MAPAARLLASLEAVASRACGLRYVCSTCRSQFPLSATRAVVHHVRRHYSSGDIPFSEKVRRKLWGTDNPPGLKDPYGGEGVIEKALRKKSEGQEEKPAEASSTKEVEDAPATPPPDYVPATTWDGLEHVGHTGKWWELPPSEQDTFYSFLPQKKLLTGETITNALHQAFVELHMVKRFDGPLNSICEILEHEPEILEFLKKVKVELSDDQSSAELIFPDEKAKAALDEYFSAVIDVAEEKEGAATQRTPSAAVKTRVATGHESQATQSTELDFLSFTLENDPNFKFTYLKRATQLTGHRIPDPQIALMNSPSNVLKYMLDASKPKPQKVAERLLSEARLASLPNVKIYDRRQTPIDQEIEVGRWKVIKEELIKRDLPVTGRATK
ncbi:hypothetical protein VTO42DRAFT_7281 [Malbranchea cinnamomea]